jgi:L-seryl-tRNA(Ser) seleniumtransferase
LPEILARTGVPIHEVGTTNRTTAADYEAAARVPGCLLLKVHRSNFALHGFTCEASIAELADVARRCHASVAFDLGAGSLVPFESHGLTGEPDARRALADGADLVTLSGDLAPPGDRRRGSSPVAAPRFEPYAPPRSHALTIDKLTLAALQATLLSYVSGDGAQLESDVASHPDPADDIEARHRLLAGWTARCSGSRSRGRGCFGGRRCVRRRQPRPSVRVRAHRRVIDC